jgi:methyltransferase (TIGR00027 family)
MEQPHPAHGTGGITHSGTGPSRTAAGVAAFRAVESVRPEDERICYDPYAVHFVSPARIAWHLNNPDKPFPGLANTIAARVRYFDDTIRDAAKEGFEQLVVMGAGYDTRAYRIEEIRGSMRVFEIDHPDTQQVKKEKIRDIFGELPDHVAYVAVDFETQELSGRLRECGYSPEKKTLFVMEGLLVYLPPEAVDELLLFIVRNSGEGSAILFDCSQKRQTGRTSGMDVQRDLRENTGQHGEPVLFGIPPEGVGQFLVKRGFSLVRNVTSEEYERMYFQGKNKGRTLYRSLSFTYAVVLK